MGNEMGVFIQTFSKGNCGYFALEKGQHFYCASKMFYGGKINSSKDFSQSHWFMTDEIWHCISSLTFWGQDVQFHLFNYDFIFCL